MMASFAARLVRVDRARAAMLDWWAENWVESAVEAEGWGEVRTRKEEGKAWGEEVDGAVGGGDGGRVEREGRAGIVGCLE